MREIQKQARAINMMLGDQQPNRGCYCKSLYNYLLPYRGKVFLFNTFTRAVYELSQEEAELFRTDEVYFEPENENMKALSDMIRARLFVKAGVDEANSYLGLGELLATAEKRNVVNDYTILTTTGCNARCFYCFEADFTPCVMKMDTASALADYIIEHLPADNVYIHWFGGEPLCNTAVMDLISQRLKERNIRYFSSITSNGFAFNDQYVEAAKNLWRTTIVQITLDGMDDEHNRRKNFYAKNCNHFRQTILNIHKLLDKEIVVSLRLNFDKENLKDIELLCDFLAEEFHGEKRLAVYPAMLFEDCGSWNPGRLKTEQLALVEDLVHLRDKLTELKLYSPPVLSSQVRYKKCGSNKPLHLTINPDGAFSVCHNYSDTCTYGTIYDGITDEKLFQEWMNNTAISPKCKNCCWLPECTAFQKCPIRRSSCVEEMEDLVKRQIIALARRAESKMTANREMA